MREAIEAGEGGAVRRDVRASNFREAEQLVSPVDFMELTPAQIRTFFSSMLFYLKKRPDLPYAELTCEVSTADGADCAEECGADEIPRDFQLPQLPWHAYGRRGWRLGAVSVPPPQAGVRP